MLDANATHITLTLEGVSADLQVLSFTGREALNEPFRLTSNWSALAPTSSSKSCCTSAAS